MYKERKRKTIERIEERGEEEKKKKRKAWLVISRISTVSVWSSIGIRLSASQKVDTERRVCTHINVT